MSRETIQWLNENTLIGFTEKRGNAWHYRKGADNHYIGAVPVEDVRKRLFDWTAVESPVILGHAVGDGDSPAFVLPDGVISGYKAISHSKTGKVFQVAKQGWTPHQYEQWLLDEVANVLDADLGIGTAGLLKGGGQAWVQVEVPDTMTFAGGVQGRPFLLATTSLDGTLATSYGAAVTNTVCDNTMAIALGEHGGYQAKIRHSSHSLTRIQDVRDALGIIHTAADGFGRQVAELLSMGFNEARFEKLLRSEFPTPQEQDSRGRKAAAARAQARRTYVHDLWKFDERVAPWTGTAFGAWQAFNTYEQHESSIRSGRVERNFRRLAEGVQAREDARLLEKIVELAA